MGVGHVPSGKIPRARPGAHLSRRQRRRAGEVRALTLTDSRHSLGAFGESFAAWFLTQRGVQVVGRNFKVAGGEIDLLALDGRTTVVVEVRTTTGTTDPLDAADEPKRRRVRRLAALVGASRVDFIGLRVDASGVDVHWLPGAS